MAIFRPFAILVVGTLATVFTGNFFGVYGGGLGVAVAFYEMRIWQNG